MKYNNRYTYVTNINIEIHDLVTNVTSTSSDLYKITTSIRLCVNRNFTGHSCSASNACFVMVSLQRFVVCV